MLIGIVAPLEYIALGSLKNQRKKDAINAVHSRLKNETKGVRVINYCPICKFNTEEGMNFCPIYG